MMMMLMMMMMLLMLLKLLRGLLRRRRRASSSSSSSSSSSCSDSDSDSETRRPSRERRRSQVIGAVREEASLGVAAVSRGEPGAAELGLILKGFFLCVCNGERGGGVFDKIDEEEEEEKKTLSGFSLFFCFTL